MTHIQAGRTNGRSHERRAVEEGQAIKEDYDPDESGRDEQIRVPTQPQVVQGHLLPKVVPYTRKKSKGRKVTDCAAPYCRSSGSTSDVDRSFVCMGERDRMFIRYEQSRSEATFQMEPAGAS